MGDVRDERGRFKKGHPGGPGRPRRQTEEQRLAAFRRAVSQEDWSAIIRRAVEQAKDGDRHARQFLAGYLIGKPTEYVVADVQQRGDVVIHLEFDE